MYKLLAVLAAAASTAVVAQSLPQLPGEFSSLVIDAININQGGTPQPDGSICCEAESPECKVQTAYQAMMQYYSVHMQAISNRGPDGSGVVMNFTDGKEYQVQADGSCVSWCPIPNSEAGRLTPLALEPNSTDMGSKTYNGQKVELYEFVEVIPIVNVTMSAILQYIDTTTSPATPVAFIQLIEPLGQLLGQENTTFSEMKVGTPAGKYFLVKDAASCPMSNQCQSDDSSSSSSDDSFKAQLSGYQRVPGTNAYSLLSEATQFDSMTELRLAFGLPVETEPVAEPEANPKYLELVEGKSDIELYNMLPKDTKMSFDKFTQVMDTVRYA